MGKDEQTCTLPARAKRRYTGLVRVGYGGMGVVYRAFDRDLERDVALKIIRPDLAADEALRTRFKREVITLSRVSHPNIVRFFDYWEEEDGVFFSMEYLQGENLTKMLKDRSIDVDEAVRLVCGLASGVFAVHGAGLVHRDIKPENIIVVEDRGPVLMDFGLAKFTNPMSGQQLTATGEMVGTLRYLPPDILSGGHADRQSDVYQLGVVLYETLTFVHPFADCSLIDYVNGRAHYKLQPPSSIVDTVDEQLDAVVMAAMAPYPEDRLSSAEGLCRLLEDWRAGRKLEIKPSTVRITGRPFFESGRLLPLLTLFAVLAYFFSRLVSVVMINHARTERVLSNLVHNSVMRGNAEEFDHLVELGASTNVVDARGDTLLHLAARRGRIGMVKKLLALGLSKKARNRDGETACDVAQKAGFRDIVSLLGGEGK